MAKEFKPDVIVDVKSIGARKLYFYPAGIALQGDLRPEDLKFGEGSPAILQRVGYIPGMQIQVDTKSKEARIVDKMGFPENEHKLLVFQQAARTERYRHCKAGTAAKDQVYNLTDFELRTWLFHIARNVDAKRFKVVKGPITSAEEVLLTGPVELCDSYGLSPKDKDRPFYYADERDVGKLEALGSIR